MLKYVILKRVPGFIGFIIKNMSAPENTSSGRPTAVPQKNDRYLFGEPRAECRNLPDPLPDLFKLFSRDLSERGIDQRFRRFELHFRRPISLKDLIWVAYPEGSDREFAMLYEKIKPQMPQYYRYKWYKNFRPAELAAELQSKAREMAIDRYMKLPG